MVVDIAGDDRFPPVEGPDLYLYLHPDGVLSVTSSDGRVQQLPLPAVIDAVHAAQDDDGTVWVSGPDSPLGLGALDAILETGPVPLQPWSATAPPVRWPNGANGFLAAARYGQDHILDDLCDRGVDVGWRDDDGNSALHYAAYGKNEHAVERLLRAGADVTQRNDEGHTPEMISLAQATDSITRLFHDRSGHLGATRQRFRNGHWLPRAVGAPAYAVVTAATITAAAAGVLPAVAAAMVLAVLVLVGLHSWRTTPPGLVASAFAIDGARLTLLRAGFRRVHVDLRSVGQVAYLGQPAGPSERYVGLGYFAVPSDLGRRWAAPAQPLDPSERVEVDTVSAWPSALMIEYDRMWRDEVAVAIGRQLVLAGAQMTPGVRREIRDAVVQAAALAANRRSEAGWWSRLTRALGLRYRPSPGTARSPGNVDGS